MNSKPSKTGPKRSEKRAEFEIRAERALRRAARKVRDENRRLGLPLIVWRAGRVARIPA